MIKEAKATGATIEEARDNALARLGAGANDDVQYEVISRPKKKVLGIFGGAPAEVRVFVEVPDEKPRRKPQPQAKQAAQKPSKPAAAKSQAEKKPEHKTAAKQPALSVSEELKNAVDVSALPENSPAKKAADYLIGILKAFGYTNITAKAAQLEKGAFISFDGEDMGAVIGRHGETLDALQYLAGLAANSENGYFKVSLNFGNYREKREETLNALAARVCEQVIRTGRSRALEPMNPYERRIIHTAVQNIDGVISGSVGEGGSRRVVIAPEGTEIRQERRPHGGRGGRPSGGRGGRGGDRRPSNTVATAPTREPKKDADLPLYGKIN